MWRYVEYIAKCRSDRLSLYITICHNVFYANTGIMEHIAYTANPAGTPEVHGIRGRTIDQFTLTCGAMSPIVSSYNPPRPCASGV